MSRLRLVLFLPTLMILAIISSTACSKKDYTFQLFCFPPGSEPHKNNWEYTANVTAFSSQTPVTKKSKKNVRITVYDKKETIFLKDAFEFESTSIKAKVAWDKFEEISVELMEVGNKFSKDPDNIALVKSGPNTLMKITYQYDPQSKEFKRKVVDNEKP